MKIILVLFTVIGILFFQNNLNAQDPLKVGHLNVVEILTALPETDSAQILLETDTKDLELMLEEMQVEYNKLVNEYQENMNNYSDLIRSTKEADIVEMQHRIQTFQQNASQQLQQRNVELMQPIYNKIQIAIDQVGVNEGYSYILDLSKGVVVFTGIKSENLNSQVLQVLGITEQ